MYVALIPDKNLLTHTFTNWASANAKKEACEWWEVVGQKQGH